MLFYTVYFVREMAPLLRLIGVLKFFSIIRENARLECNITGPSVNVTCRILFAAKTQSGSRLCQTNQTIRRPDCIAETGA